MKILLRDDPKVDAYIYELAKREVTVQIQYIPHENVVEMVISDWDKDLLLCRDIEIESADKLIADIKDAVDDIDAGYGEKFLKGLRYAAESKFTEIEKIAHERGLI